MAQEILILARRHGANPSEPREILVGPSTAHGVVKAQFKALCSSKTNPDYAEIEIGFFAGERKQRFDAETPKQEQQPKKKFKNEKA